MLYRQGDVMFVPVRTLPKGKKTARKNGVVALGEVTGHSHRVAVEEGAEVLDIAEKGLFVRVTSKGVSIQHEEHGVIKLPKGDFEVRIQREYTPEAIRNVLD